MYETFIILLVKKPVANVKKNGTVYLIFYWLVWAVVLMRWAYFMSLSRMLRFVLLE
ncbi:hypothetical protein CY0110_16882 [Crocosphaera chwakensis CCY0110]|uniref:Uncharacterized protein n=1 Tax=Crocosphaera chwakensis CCY0110 TaxID=391612 RepID=A3II58_9CHRO|nr:hypothetical protein CY0110_16882 [Crocosphaera chwakensis CCY0110]